MSQALDAGPSTVEPRGSMLTAPGQIARPTSPSPALEPVTILPRLFNFIRLKVPQLPPGITLENVRHLSLVSDGPLCDVREDVRAQEAYGRRFVCKILKRSISPRMGSSITLTEPELRRLQHEVRVVALAKIRECEHIVGLFGISFGILAFDPLQICPVLKFEQADLGNLTAFQAAVKRDAVGMELRIGLAADVAAGLGALHAAGLVHGTLEPSHVLVFRHPERRLAAKICGLGSSFFVDERDPGSVPFIRNKTNPWTAPEVREGCTKPDELHNVDVFVLGLLFWQIFVHKDVFATFDLPLAAEYRTAEIQAILRVPYLFRFIPLIVEHEVGGFVDEQHMDLFLSLFECTVRLNPRKRNFSRVLAILESYTHRELHSAPKEPDDTLSEKDVGETNMVGQSPTKSSLTALDELEYYVDSLRKLPWIVIEQLFDACQSISKSPGNTSTEDLHLDSIRIRLLCNLHGLGIEKNLAQAREILDALGEKQPIASRLSQAILLQAESSGAAQPSFEDIFEQLKLNPPTPTWKEELARLLASPDTHGFTVDRDLAIHACSSLVKGPNAILDFGGGNTLLHAVAFYGLVQELDRVLSLGNLDINSRNANGDTALIIACQLGRLDIAMPLLKKDANTQIFNARGESAIYWLVGFSLQNDQKLDPEQILDLGNNLMMCGNGLEHYESRTSPFESIKVGVAQCMPLSDYGRMPGAALLQATLHEDIYAMRYILAFYLNQLEASQDNPRDWAVQLAVMFHKPIQLASELHLDEALTLLLHHLGEAPTLVPPHNTSQEMAEVMADVSRDSRNVGRLYYSLYGREAAGHFVASAIDYKFDLRRSYHHGAQKAARNILTLQILGTYGFLTNVMVVGNTVQSTVHYAVMQGTLDSVRYLLALPSLRSESIDMSFAGMTPVHEALNHHRLDVLRVLVESGATIDLRQKRDPQHCLSGVEASYIHVLGSLRYGADAFAELLLEHGAPAKIEDNRGSDALTLALYRGAFDLFRLLLSHGESLNRKTVVGTTPLGSLFIPEHARQVDDLAAALRFMLSLEPAGSDELFIAVPELQSSVIHIAASRYNPDPIGRELLEILLAHYSKAEQVNAKANNPAKSTPLQTAVQALNPVAVELLLKAGADHTVLDLSDRTCLDVASSALEKLVFTGEVVGPAQGGEFERATRIVRLLAERSGWPGMFAGLPPAFEAMEAAAPFRDLMRQSIHRVASMRKLENQTLGTLNQGMETLLLTADLPMMALYKHIAESWGEGAVRVDVDFRVLGSIEALNPQYSYERVRAEAPWLRSLSNARLLDFQTAAAFEWLLDQAITTNKQDGEPSDQSSVLLKFALSRDEKDLPLPATYVRYPQTLLRYYRSVLQEDDLILAREHRGLIEQYISLLLRREEALKDGGYFLPPFDDEFSRFHFDILQPVKLEPEEAVWRIALATRCRCFHGGIGVLSRFEFQDAARRAAQLSEAEWKENVKLDREERLKYHDDHTEWTGRFGVQGNRTFSLFFDATMNPITRFFDRRPEPKKDDAPPEQNKPMLPWPKLGFTYRPLDHDKKEVRLLTLLPCVEPEVESDGGIVHCKIEYCSLDDLSEEYKEYLSTVQQHSTAQMIQHDWEQILASHPEPKPKRYNWGDFSALSYTWGSPDNMRPIILNGARVLVGVNLEAGLRVLRDIPEFSVDGLKLWTDAICINQTDLEEKSRVIPAMQHLYQVAAKVTVWLGSEADTEGKDKMSARNLADIVQNFVDQHVSGSLVDDRGFPGLKNLNVKPINALHYTTTVLPALVDLMSHPYWFRLWIIQEIVASSHEKVFHLGPAGGQLSWSTISALLHAHYNHVSENPNFASEDFDSADLGNTEQAIGHAMRLAEWDALYRAEGSSIGADVKDWADALGLGVAARVTDDRDRVYGLLGLLPGDITRWITPDYTKTTARVFVDLSLALLNVQGHDDVFSGQRWPGNTPGLPSWAIDMTQPRTGRTRLTTARASGDWDRIQALLTRGGAVMPPRVNVPDGWWPSLVVSDDYTVLKVLVLRVDVVDSVGIAEEEEGDREDTGDKDKTSEEKENDKPKTTEGATGNPLYPYAETEDELRTILVRILGNNIRMTSNLDATFDDESEVEGDLAEENTFGIDSARGDAAEEGEHTVISAASNPQTGLEDTEAAVELVNTEPPDYNEPEDVGHIEKSRPSGDEADGTNGEGQADKGKDPEKQQKYSTFERSSPFISALFTIPWIEADKPNALEEEAFARAGWSGVLALDTFAVFQEWRLQNAAYPLWGGRTLRDFFPPGVEALADPAMGIATPAHVVRVQNSLDMAWGIVIQQFFTTKEQRFLGMSVRGVEPGDEIVVTPGCSFAVILRPLPDAEREPLEKKLAGEEGYESGKRWYRVVGESYVEGIMEGEALDWIGERNLQIESVHLV